MHVLPMEMMWNFVEIMGFDPVYIEKTNVSRTRSRMHGNYMKTNGFRISVTEIARGREADIPEDLLGPSAGLCSEPGSRLEIT